ncbi:hypothetical protein COT47_04810 [Candidatus Woesearchaeota archaeon CG08_land_8_20_14_0_20_43_7]|nr:MAG: hypothetical protein COT47_04810 [Candidatus Woesearchaeota archaeon CG08_land_8_20_14_0_20_43_7]
MRICPHCYTSVYGSGVKKCPYCAIPFTDTNAKEEEYQIPKVKHNGVFIFLGITVILIASIMTIDWIANGGIKFNIGKDCGYEETCFLTGLAVCDVNMEVKPNSYGLLHAQIIEKRGDMCYVAVQAVEYDREANSDMSKEKLCAFDVTLVNETGIDDLFFCKNTSISGEDGLTDVSDQEWADEALDRTQDIDGQERPI